MPQLLHAPATNLDLQREPEFDIEQMDDLEVADESTLPDMNGLRQL